MSAKTVSEQLGESGGDMKQDVGEVGNGDEKQNNHANRASIRDNIVSHTAINSGEGKMTFYLFGEFKQNIYWHT